ncbi:D-2-hydroxyacid dehydrogenase family protein [Phaeacidiphilus oryzae]|uniref:D-2-hydroxyacid dehydrogenase family protein n=1 Tax=Phaeacidiphilus oryzae TaxID=348818 RepID=UPI000569C2C4|nr:D-2-hydroxyacid dehydrogenase family protein [Phaeacidiphilus oryzae]
MSLPLSTERTRIAVLDDYNDAAARLDVWSGLPAGCAVDFLPEHLSDQDALAERLAPYQAVIAMRERTPFPAELLARLPELRLLVTTGQANASIDVAAARARGVTVCGTRMSRYAAAELTWALILELARGAGAQDASLRSGGWQAGVGTGLDGRTLGVIGLGRLGSRVASIGAAFGMEVLAWTRHMTPERAAEAGATPVASREELLERSDVVSLHLRLNAETRGIIGAAELARMKPTAWLVNTSRGPLVDEAALASALRAGTIGGAGLDVYDIEPLPAGSPLLDAPNTVLTPHIGYVTADCFELAYGDAAEDVTAWLAGRPVREL